jgi:Bacterial regulatory proteins, luxR family
MYDVLGRETELAALGAFRDRLRSGPGALVLAGVAGVGKTTLLRAGAALAERCTKHAGRRPRAVRAGRGTAVDTARPGRTGAGEWPRPRPPRADRNRTAGGRTGGTGLSNRQVAAELFVTVRAVESTLTKAYAKLGIRSRTQLAAWLNQSG